ncbi:MAG: GNAT family N-acetyltransferase [Anaerolineaceae bacterium]|nr:GNAT family N-acetyltransferase [Anaerolineaceae bacterium]MCB9101289.1 GNAT family N-acetyltransferase [Anaerolineales bacterium]
MQTTIYTDASGFETLAHEWDDLLERAVNAPFFMRYGYQSAWWRCLGNDDLFLIAIRTDEGQLVGLAPLYGETTPAGQRQLTFVGCVDVSDYLDLLVDADHVEAVHHTLITCLADEGVPWDKLYLCSLPHNSITPTQLAETARRQGWQVDVRQQDICPVITLPADWETYLAGVDKKQRHEIRRKMRKIEREAETRWYVVDSLTDLDQAMTDFITLHQKSTQDKEDFWSEPMIQFFKTVAKILAQAGWLKLYFIEVNGILAATMLCFDYNNEFLLYNSGYDPEQFAQLSPGNVLTSYTLRHAIELGRSRYDFLRGDEEYKFRFGAVAEPVYDLEITRR